MSNYIQQGYWQEGYTEIINTIISGSQSGRELTDEALSRLVSQFQDSPKLKALVEAIVNPLDNLLFDVDNIGTKRWIDTAEGYQLDGCGYIVGEPRYGRSDDEYRSAIKFRVFINVSDGTPNDLIKGLRFLTNPVDCQYLESYPATSILFTDGYSVPQDINLQIQDLSPAATSDIQVCVSYAYKPFRFGEEPPPGELFVNNGEDYLTANESDIQVSSGAEANVGSSLGGIVPTDLVIGSGAIYLGTESDYFIAVYNPNTNKTIGHDYLTGVYQ